MKKYLFLLAVLLIASCTKPLRPGYVEATIGYSVLSSGAMTKSEITRLIEGTLPDNIQLTLSKDGNTTTITSGEKTELAVGRYAVTAKYVQKKQVSLAGSAVVALESPSFYIQDSLLIVYNRAEYSVGANYDCFAIVSDLISNAGIKVTGAAEELPLKKDGTWGVSFIRGNLSNRNLVFTVMPNPGYESTSFTASGSYVSGGFIAREGYYYVLRAKQIETVEGGGINYELPNWEGGSL